MKVNSGLVTLLRGSGRGGGEYTVPEVRGYPCPAPDSKADEPDPCLNRKCLWEEKHTQKKKEIPTCNLLFTKPYPPWLLLLRLSIFHMAHMAHYIDSAGRK